jgi:DNA-binding NarL/FixJ family response regulator
VPRMTRGEVSEIAGAGAVASVGLVAAEEITRRRLNAVLARGGFEITVTGESVEGLIASCRESEPEVLVLACELSPPQRRTPLSLLRNELPEWPIVVVSASDHRSAVGRALRAGAAGYVHEADIDDVLALTVRAVRAGQTCVPQATNQRIAPEALSHREKQVLELVTMGLTNFEIAQRLYLSESTIKSHLSTSFRKLDVCSRAEAAAVVLDPDY